jgi:signal transduction histidine kinase
MKAKTPNNPMQADIKILVIDDRDDNLFSIEAILEKDNYTIVKANSGKAALKILLNQQDFSLILMDVQMPEMNGFETAKIIYERDRLKDIPIIFITAHDYDEEIIFRGYRTGGVDYIYKPINPELLRVKVGVFVELYRKNHQLLMHEQNLLAANHSLKKEIEERTASEEKVRLLNARLLENNNHLKAVNEELDQFAYAASHDLQEPLRKIQVFSDKILSMQKQDQETEKYFKKIIKSSERMQLLINDILAFSRHSMSIDDFKITDLDAILRDVLAELDVEVELAGADIKFTQLPKISAVPSLIRQLFHNLVKNAIKFHRPNVKPVIEINSTEIEGGLNGEGAKIEISVSDNGIGFDEKYSEDIFRVFKRLHSYHEFEGTGVGLSICKKIVEKHNGHIYARSRTGEGASFFVQLPLGPPVKHDVAMELEESNTE